MEPTNEDKSSALTTAPSSPVKDAIDANSGRFEFFKQTLTLGSAGVAGMAALFTDPSRIPSRPIPLLFSSLASLALLTILVWSTFGLSTYANLLKKLALESKLISLPESKDPNPSSYYTIGVVRHAQTVIVALFVAATSLIGLTAVNAFFPSKTNLLSAIDVSQRFLAKDIGQQVTAVDLQEIESSDRDFALKYRVGDQESVVFVDKSDGKVTKYVRTTKDKPTP